MSKFTGDATRPNASTITSKVDGKDHVSRVVQVQAAIGKLPEVSNIKVLTMWEILSVAVDKTQMFADDVANRMSTVSVTANALRLLSVLPKHRLRRRYDLSELDAAPVACRKGGYAT